MTNFSQYNSQIFFGLGIIAQLVFTIGRNFTKSDFTKLLESIGASTIIGLFFHFIVGRMENPALTSILLSLLFLSIFFTLLFRGKILPQINEMVIMLWTIGLLYLYFSVIRINNLTLLLPTPIYIILILLIFKTNFNTFGKTVLYLWFMVMGLVISVISFPSNVIFPNSSNLEINLYRSFISGMLCFYIFTYLIYIFYFIPFPNKHQRFSERIENIKEHARLLASKLDSFQFSPLIMLTILMIIVSGLYINSYFELINGRIIFLLLFVFPSIISTNMENRQTPPIISS